MDAAQSGVDHPRSGRRRRCGVPLSPASAPRRVRLWEIALAFLWLSTTTYGGAQSAAIQREIARSRRWIDEDEFLTMRALALVAPGSNSPNLAILIGQHLRGRAGAAIAFLGATLPGAAIALALSLVFLDPRLHGLNVALRGCAAAAVGLSVASAIQMSGRLRTAPQAHVMVLTALAAAVLHLQLWLTLLVFVPLAVLLDIGGGPAPTAARREGPDAEAG